MTLTEIRDITNIDFKQKGSKFYASCYMDGTSHARWDKLTVRKAPDGQMVFQEAGGECIGLKQWLETYGDASKYVRPSLTEEPVKVEQKFVHDSVWKPTFPNVYLGHLFHFLASKFGIVTTHKAFVKYSTGEDCRGNSVFWYRNEAGQWLHDVVVPYLATGNRNKSLKMDSWRTCKTGGGFTGRSLFGQHLLRNHNGEVCVVESEKTALIMSMADTKSRLWLATGGSNKTAHIRKGWKLFPDFDAAGKFWECIGCENKYGEDCIIKAVDVDGRKQKVKEWDCEFKNKDLVPWFNGLSVSEGHDVADWVLDNLKRK